MRGIRLAACMAVFAALGVASASASADAPEFGRCIKKAAAGGTGYSNAACTLAGTEGEAKYEWLAGPGPKPGFAATERFAFGPRHKQCSVAVSELQLADEDRALAKTAAEPEKAELLRAAETHQIAGEQRLAVLGTTRSDCERRLKEEQAKAPVVLRPVGKGPVVECSGMRSTGEYTGAATIGSVAIVLTECGATNGSACQSSGAVEGEIDVSPLVGELGVIRAAAFGVTPKYGLALRPASGTTFAEFECGGVAVVIGGSVARQVTVGKMATYEKERFIQSSGKQKVTGFVGMSPDLLSASFEGGEARTAGLTLRGLLKNEEPIEINPAV